MEIKKLVMPVIHSNGDRAETLREQACEVSAKLRDAMDAFKKAYPNGRNYYPKGHEAMEEAQKATDQHYNVLKQIQDEWDEMAHFCYTFETEVKCKP